MNKETLIQLFKAPYKRQAFIDNGLLPTFQGKVGNLKIYDAQGLQTIELTASEQTYAVSAVKYGEFQTLDEIPRTIELYEIIVNDNKQIERSRVGLGALVKKHIIGNNAVLVNFAYQSPEKRTWRFSFIARDGVFQDGEMQIKDTHPKRYTYVFGEPEETYKTALDRFFVLGNELEITINKIKDAFGVEAMSKAFFDEYRDAHYAGFVDYLMRSNFKKSAFNGNDKDVRDFVKKLLGRIVFLYFLQKKGWLGAKDTSYKNGDKNFMTNFFKKAGANDAFYANWLSKLFFDALNNERPNDDFKMPDGEVVKIPYLNGGLFEKETEKYDYLTFPADLFTNLFEFFDQYNFTIFESSPDDHTVAVDPEMLGHIFENLLEDNKDKGAFYTPKEIVHYMTQESLIEFLHTQLPDADRTELENFVKNQDNKLSKEHKRQIDEKLDTVKICDPAIGSGAFPMGLLQEIFGLKERIAYDLGYKVWSPATVKENIIQKSIYGVDIERGAVDIARLRFWLSLIVDEEMPKALPNLDYKIVVGNSLVSKFNDTVIEIDWSDDTAKEGLFGQEIAEDKKTLLQEIFQKQMQYFTADNTLKEKLNLEIRNLKLDILTKQLELMIENKGFKDDSMQGLNKKQIEAWQQTQDWKKALSDIRTLKDNPNKSFSHFDWKLDFPEVLNPLVNEATGFDIVIGNPPYIEFKKLPESDKKTFGRFKTATRKYDIFGLFIELTTELLKEKGIHSFINPTTFLMKDFGSPIRKVINDNFKIIEIFDFADYQIFETAITYTGIFIYRKQKELNEYSFIYQRLNGSEKANDRASLFLSKDSNKFKTSSEILSDKLVTDSWIFGSKENENLLAKIEAQKPTLKDLTKYIFVGIQSGKDDVFFLTKETIAENSLESELLYPILKGKDVRKYSSDWSGTYILYPYDKKSNKVIDENVLKSKFPNIYNYLLERKDNLKGRSYFEKSNKLWYELWCERNLSKFMETKIVNAEISPENRFQLDTSGILGNTKIFSTVLKDEWKQYNLVLLAILNSKLLNYYHKKIASPKAGGFFDYKTQFIQKYPIKFPKEKIQLETLASFLMKLNDSNFNKQIEELIPNKHISEAFEEVIDALVFELYFPEEFAEKGIAIEKYANEIFKPIEGLSEDEQVKAIQEAYQALRAKDNPLRNQIKLMKIELKELLLPILSV